MRSFQQLFIWSVILFRRFLHAYICLDIYTGIVEVEAFEMSFSQLTGFANDVFHCWNYWTHYIGHISGIHYFKYLLLGLAGKRTLLSNSRRYHVHHVFSAPHFCDTDFFSWNAIPLHCKHAFLLKCLRQIMTQAVRMCMVILSSCGNKGLIYTIITAPRINLFTEKIMPHAILSNMYRVCCLKYKLCE